jgi:hypothetical protein
VQFKNGIGKFNGRVVQSYTTYATIHNSIVVM